MATLTRCKTCTKPVSTDAARCPHCGEPTRNRRVLIAILLIAGAIWLSFDLIVAIVAPLFQ